MWCIAFSQTRSPYYKHTFCTTQVDNIQNTTFYKALETKSQGYTDTYLIERFVTALEAEPQIYRHIEILLKNKTIHVFCTFSGFKLSKLIGEVVIS